MVQLIQVAGKAAMDNTVVVAAEAAAEAATAVDTVVMEAALVASVVVELGVHHRLII
jgi:hypothetical protein